MSQVNAGDTAAEAAPNDRSTRRPALRISLAQRAHQGCNPHTGELDSPVLASAGHLVDRAWHCVLSPALDPGSSDTARSLAMCPALSSAPCCRPPGLLQGCSHRSLLPSLCPTRWPGAALACDIHTCVSPCCRRRGLLLSNRPRGGALTPPVHLSVDLGAPVPHTALACPGTSSGPVTSAATLSIPTGYKCQAGSSGLPNVSLPADWPSALDYTCEFSFQFTVTLLSQPNNSSIYLTSLVKLLCESVS